MLFTTTKSILRAFSCISIVFLVLGLSGCGKYAKPRSPEDMSPKEVASLTILPQQTGVAFNWKTPEKNQIDKELKQIDGYIVYRKLIIRDSDIIDREIEFEEIGNISDTHLQELEKLRLAAIAEDKPTRRLKVDETLKEFTFTDTTVKPGQTYLYKIVPVNQKDVEGAYDQLIKVLFRGDASEVVIIPYTTFKEESFLK